MIANRVLRSTRLCTAACSQGGSRPALGAPIFRASSSDAELHTTGSSNTAPAASSSNQMHSSRTAHRNVPDAAANAKDGAVWSDGRWVSSGAHASSSVDNQDLPKSASPKKSPPPSSSPTTSHSSESPIPLVANSMLEMTLRGRASRAVKENKIEEAMDSWRQLQARSLHLDTDVVVKMLHMCVSQGAMKGRKSNAHRMARVRREGDNSQTDYARAFQLFDGLVASGVRPPPEAFNLVSKAFGDAGNARYAAKVEQVMNAQREADSSAPRPSPLFTSNVITAHCRAGSLHMAAPLYEQMKAEGLRGTAAMYSAVAAAFASRGFPEFAAGCIGDMMGHAFVPPVSLCAAVVEAAAVKGDAKTLTLAVGWLSAHGGAMDRGTCQVCFDVAARACNPRLAAQVWNLAFSPRLGKGHHNHGGGFGYAPTADAYAAMIQCFGVAKDDASMLAALLELCAAPGLDGGPEGIVDVAAKHLSLSIGRADDAFFVLQKMHAAHQQQVAAAAAQAEAQQQQIRQEAEEVAVGRDANNAEADADDASSSHDGATAAPEAEVAAEPSTSASSSAPPLRAVHVTALNAVIRACALQGSLERAFATFDSLSDFGLEPNERTFAGLLQACANSSSKGNQNAGVAAALLEEMKSRYDLEPGPAEYHWATLALAQGGHWKEAEDLIERASYRGFAMSVTRLQLAHVKLNLRDIGGAEALVKEVHESGARLPAPLLNRLKVARENSAGSGSSTKFQK